MKRRSFSKILLASSAGQAVPRWMYSRPQKIRRALVLGGTSFVGPAIVERLSKHFEVTLFNRGITNPDLFRELPLITGDRYNGRDSYQDILAQHWDFVIDVWPEEAHLVETAADMLKKHCDHYIFISSIAVYKDFAKVGLHEESGVVDIPMRKEDRYYPEEKLAAENAVREKYPENHTIVRAGPIKGWRDPALDLVYWLTKVSSQREVLAPGSGDDFVQFVDVKDVGSFVEYACTNQISGTYNCTGPSLPLQWLSFLNQMKALYNPEVTFRWAPESFLQDQNVRSFSDLPLWAPVSEDRGFMQIDNQKILGRGFEFRSITESFSDTLAWYHLNWKEGVSFGVKPIEVGLSSFREQELLSKMRKL